MDKNVFKSKVEIVKDSFVFEIPQEVQAQYDKLLEPKPKYILIRIIGFEND